MRFDWKPESKERYFRKATAAVKAAGFDDILRVDKDQFSIVKGTVKVHFKPISIKVIEEYLNLALCYCPEEDFNNKMSIPNNSILKDGKVKGGRS